MIATGIFPPDIGGPATYSFTIADELTRKNFSVKIITYSDSNKLKIQNSKFKIKENYNYRIVTVSRKISKGLRHFIYFLSCLFHGLHSDIIYAQDTVSAGFPAVIAAKILRKRFFVKVTGDYAWEQAMSRFGIEDPIEAFQFKRYSARVEFLRFFQAFSARHADSVVVPSLFLKRLVLGWMIEADKIQVIHNSVDDKFLGRMEDARNQPEVIASIRNSLGVKDGGKLVLSIGRLVKWKGFESLIDVFGNLSLKFPDMKLLIIGKGPEMEKIVAKISSSPAAGNIFLMDRMPQSRLADYLVSSDIFVLNASYEGFSHQIVEAMAAGTPVVATSAGGNPEIIEDGVNGVLVSYGNKAALGKAVEVLIKDKDLCEKILENGRKTAALFSKKKMIDELEKLITKSAK